MTFQGADSWSTLWKPLLSWKSWGLGGLFYFLFHRGTWICGDKMWTKASLKQGCHPWFCLGCVCHTQLLLWEEKRNRLRLRLVEWSGGSMQFYCLELGLLSVPGTRQVFCVCLPGGPLCAHTNSTGTCDLCFECYPSYCSELLVWSTRESFSWLWEDS
jgi:hypothetical protein